MKLLEHTRIFFGRFLKVIDHRSPPRKKGAEKSFRAEANISPEATVVGSLWGSQHYHDYRPDISISDHLGNSHRNACDFRDFGQP